MARIFGQGNLDEKSCTGSFKQGNEVTFVVWAVGSVWTMWSLTASVLTGMAVWLWPGHRANGRISRMGSMIGAEIPSEHGMHEPSAMAAKPGTAEKTGAIGITGIIGTAGMAKAAESAELTDSAGTAMPCLPSIDGVACVSALQASVKSGATLVGAFEELGGMPFATAELTPFRIRLVVRARSLPKERREQIDLLSGELYAACRLSADLGCETSHCLDVVASSLKRRRLMDDLRANVFAMPQATVKLLLALPLVTLLLGETIGARPFAFLFGNSKGLLCLGFAACCYALGLLWVRVLMKGAT